MKKHTLVIRIVLAAFGIFLAQSFNQTFAEALTSAEQSKPNQDQPKQTPINCFRGMLTVYNPASDDEFEGGRLNRWSEPLIPVEASAGVAAKKDSYYQNKPMLGMPISVSMDPWGEFGKRCNQRKKRCTLLAYVKGFDQAFPDYKKTFANLPKDSFVAIVDDDGGPLKGKGYSHVDMASIHPRYFNAFPWFLSTRISYQIIPSCDGSAVGRKCNYSGKWKPAGLDPKCIPTANSVK